VSFAEKLTGKDVSGYSALSFYIKGDANARMEVTLKTPNGHTSNLLNLASYVGISSEWQQVSVPLSDFDWNYGDFNIHDVYAVMFYAREGAVSGNFKAYIDNLEFTSPPSETERRWAYEDRNGDGAWNWSYTAWDPGTSLEVGNQWNDIAVTNDEAFAGTSSLKFAVSRQDGGYINAYLTTSSDGSGLEANGWDDREAPKDISGYDALRFYVKGDALTHATIDLIETSNRNANPVELTDYVSNINNTTWQEVRIPLDDLRAASSDFTQIREIWIRVQHNHPSADYTFSLDNIRFVAGSDAPARNWAVSDPNQNGVWNWSTTFSSGGSTLEVGNEWGDIIFVNGELVFNISHNGTGTAGGNITTGYGAGGVEPASGAERDAGKAVNPEGALTFQVAFNPPNFPTPLIRLVDAAGRQSAPVLASLYYTACGAAACSASIPTALFATPDFDFAAVKSVTPFVDGTVTAGTYAFRLSNLAFSAAQ
jgi:hypothetical protein